MSTHVADINYMTWKVLRKYNLKQSKHCFIYQGRSMMPTNLKSTKRVSGVVTFLKDIIDWFVSSEEIQAAPFPFTVISGTKVPNR